MNKPLTLRGQNQRAMIAQTAQQPILQRRTEEIKMHEQMLMACFTQSVNSINLNPVKEIG